MIGRPSTVSGARGAGLCIVAHIRICVFEVGDELVRVALERKTLALVHLDDLCHRPLFRARTCALRSILYEPVRHIFLDHLLLVAELRYVVSGVYGEPYSARLKTMGY
jgi:hypothetical protein